MGIAVLSYRSLPHWGRGTASAVDRVLSYTDRLRRSPPLFFIPLVPYPAHSARHLPHAGKALSVVILFPHMRVFVLTMREKQHPRIAAFPIGQCYYVKRQNFLGSPSGELPEGVVQANWIFRSEATRKSSETPFRTK